MTEDLLWTPFKLVSSRPSLQQEPPAFQSLYVNNHFHVTKETYQGDEPDGSDTLVHLSIRRNDRAPVRDWRMFQRIKNELTDPECEAVELYPAESRLVDTSNQYHLWVFAPGFKMPVGFGERLVAGPGELNDDPRLDGLMTDEDKARTFQRPFGQEHRAVGQDKCTACGSTYSPRKGCNCPPVEIIWEEA